MSREGSRAGKTYQRRPSNDIPLEWHIKLCQQSRRSQTLLAVNEKMLRTRLELLSRFKIGVGIFEVFKPAKKNSNPRCNPLSEARGCRPMKPEIGSPIAATWGLSYSSGLIERSLVALVCKLVSSGFPTPALAQDETFGGL